MEKIFSNIVSKSIILTILPLIYPSLFFFALSINENGTLKKWLIIASCILAIPHLKALIFCGKKEKKQNDDLKQLKNIVDKSPKEVRASSSLLQIYSKIIKDNADKLYENIKTKKGHSDITDWQWMYSNGDELCSKLHSFIKEMAEKGKEFSVSIMFRITTEDGKGFTMSSRASDDVAHVPISYRRFVSEEDASGSYYKELMDNNLNKPEILINKKEVEEKLKGISGKNYSQYIALPIACKGKTVGLLQIMAYNGSVLSTDRKEIKRFCNNYFSIAANTMLLADKNENIAQII